MSTAIVANESVGAVILGLPIALAACSARVPSRAPAVSGAQSSVRSPASHGKTFTSTRYGFRLDYPAELQLRRTFQRSYFGNGNWKAYAGVNPSPGYPVVALVMPGSNHITAGELRIGASRDAKALETCTRIPDAARPRTQGTSNISGVTFTTFQAGDAGMNHYLETHSYRAVHKGTCYAIDVMAIGTNPQVYAPPAEPPFGRQQVFTRLVPVVRGLRFIGQ